MAERLIWQLEIGTGAAKMPPPGPIPPGGGREGARNFVTDRSYRGGKDGR